MYKLEYRVCVCVYGGVEMHFCWKQRIKLENARTLHLTRGSSDPQGDATDHQKLYLQGTWYPAWLALENT